MPDRRKYWFHTLLLILTVSVSCSGRLTRVEEYRDGEWQVVDWELTRTQVQRDGSTIIVQFVIEGPDDQRVSIESHLRVNPEATFSYGKWTHVRGTSVVTSGSVQSDRVDFLGGQGGSPSVGGVLELKLNDGTRRFRVSIPPTEATEVRWP